MHNDVTLYFKKECGGVCSSSPYCARRQQLEGILSELVPYTVGKDVSGVWTASARMCSCTEAHEHVVECLICVQDQVDRISALSDAQIDLLADVCVFVGCTVLNLNVKRPV
jgi:hypothetical protein